MVPRPRKFQAHQLTIRIAIGMLSGLVVGVFLNAFYSYEWIQNYLTGGLFHVVGKVFMSSLQMLVVPLVLVSLICGTSSLDNIKKLGRIGGKTLALYLATTALAISVAVIASTLVQPGAGFELTTSVQFKGREAPPITDVLINIIPSNPIRSMTEGNMLQIIFFAILFGLAVTASGRSGETVSRFFHDLNEVIMKMIVMLMVIAPYGVFCLIAKVFAEQGFSAILPLAKYFFLVLGVLLIHASVVYPLLLTTLSGLNPKTFFKKIKDAPIFAFSTASSNATLPITLETAQRRLGVKSQIASFTIPLGATINMDGSAIMQGVATVFIAQAYNIDLSMADYLMVILTATLASVGTAGVPGVAAIMLAMVLKQVGLPVEGIGLILGVDRLLDMCRTAVNVIGDCAVTCIVAKSEGALSKEIFNRDQKD